MSTYANVTLDGASSTVPYTIDGSYVLSEMIAIFIPTNIQLLIFGIFTCCALRAVQALYRGRLQRRLSSVLIGTTVALFVLNLTYVGLTIAFVIMDLTETLSTDWRDERYYMISQAMKAIQIAVLFLLDATMTYRCYVVYDSFWVVVIPALASIAATVIGFVSLAPISNGNDITAGFYVVASEAYIATSFCVSFITSSLIAGRIWWTHRQTARHISSGSKLSSVLRIFVESALIHVFTLGAWISVIFTTYTGMFTMQAVTPPLLGIAFSLLITRVGSGNDHTAKSMALPTLQFASTTFGEDLEKATEKATPERSPRSSVSDSTNATLA